MRFKKSTAPCFARGSVWTNTTNKGKVQVISTDQFGSGKYDFDVHYKYDHSDESVHIDAWEFQRRFKLGTKP